MIGKGSVIAYPMDTSLKKHGGGLDKISFQQLGSADVLTALQNGGVDSAWLLDPVWRKVDGDKRYAFLGGQPVGEPLGGLLFGPTLLTEDPDAGVAFLRAYIRTVNTYFAGDYKSDPAFVTELAKLMKIDEATLRSTPSMRMDWEIRTGTTDRLQAGVQRRRASRRASRRYRRRRPSTGRCTGRRWATGSDAAPVRHAQKAACTEGRILERIRPSVFSSGDRI